MRDINLLHPTLKPKCKQLIKLCNANGISIIITQTLRNKEEQEDCVKRRTSKLHYPKSFHCWGTAFDFAIVNNGEVDWNCTDLYEKVGQLGKTLGIIWGGDFKSFKDMPHFELPNQSVSKLITEYKTPEGYIKTWQK